MQCKRKLHFATHQVTTCVVGNEALRVCFVFSFSIVYISVLPIYTVLLLLDVQACIFLFSLTVQVPFVYILQVFQIAFYVQYLLSAVV